MQAWNAHRIQTKNVGDTFEGGMGDSEEAAPLLDTFEEVFPPTPLPNADLFEKEIQNEPIVTSALAGKCDSA
jgi:hypothetical protein